MTANAINAKSEALELHELSAQDLDAVAGGDLHIGVGVCTNDVPEEQSKALNDFAALVQKLSS
jgi:hypothetical protein